MDRSPFTGHYKGWIKVRLAFLFDTLSKSTYEYRSVLEVGAGYGDIGRAFANAGAFVTITDGRQDQVDEIRRRHGSAVQDAYILDLMEEHDYPCTVFDMVLCLGVLYHVPNPRLVIQRMAAVTGSTLVLEGEVLDTKLDTEVRRKETGYDQSIHGVAVGLSAKRIERYLEEVGFTYKRYDNARLNASEIHDYTWKERPHGCSWINGRRRLWICKRST